MSRETSVEVGKGYDFAYFAWMRTADFGSYRQALATRGFTFFHAFHALQVQAVLRG